MFEEGKCELQDSTLLKFAIVLIKTGDGITPLTGEPGVPLSPTGPLSPLGP